MNDQFDFLVLGGGSAGYAAARTAAALGLRTAVVDGAAELGGLCILRGCMPSKTLLESAHRAEVVRGAGEFGLHADYRGFSGAAILARKRRLIEEFASYRQGQLGDGRFELLRGHGKFRDARTVEVRMRDGGLRVVTARAALVATGSVIAVPEIPGLETAGFLTSDDVLDSADLPASVIVLGGGAIALELATFYNGLGIPTTVIQRSAQVLREMDGDVADAVADGMSRRGVTVHRGTQISRVERTESGRRVIFFQDGIEQSVEAAALVCALGRRPAVDGLELRKAGVALDGGRIVAQPTQQCGAAHLFAAGDVCGPHEVVHLAIQQGEIAARNAARVLRGERGGLERMDYSNKLFAVFTQPEAAAVGLSAAEAGPDALSASYPFNDHGKSMCMGETDGFVKLIAERGSGRLLGGACVGPHASELIHEIAVAIHFRATAADLARVPHYHPTLSEIWTYPAEELADLAGAVSPNENRAL